MKKKGYSAVLLLFITFASFAQPKVCDLAHRGQWLHQYQSHYADTAESPDEFLGNAIREVKP